MNRRETRRDSTAIGLPGWRPSFLELFVQGPKPEEEQRERAQRRHSTSLLESRPQAEEVTPLRKSTTDACQSVNDRSIPSTIDPLVIYFPTSSQSSQSSVVSELTLMTYSKEKAEILKEAYFKRVDRERRDLTDEKRHELLREIEQELDLKYKHQAKEPKKEQGRMQKSGDGNDLLSRFKALKQSQSQRTLGGNKEQLSGYKQIKPRTRKNEERESYQSKEQRKERIGGLVQSFSSTGTAKVSNSKRHLMVGLAKSFPSTANLAQSFSSTANSMEFKTEETMTNLTADCKGGTEELEKDREISTKKDHALTPKSGLGKDPWSAKQGLLPEDETNIGKIIELKLLVAEQQAAIDTLASKLHNAELANRQLRHIDQVRTEKFEAEYRRLAEQLHECLGREVDEGREHKLARENEELRHDLALVRGRPTKGEKMRASISTVTTDVPSDVDSVDSVRHTV